MRSLSACLVGLLLSALTLAAEPQPVTPGSHDFPSEVKFGEVWDILEPPKAEISMPTHWLVFEAAKDGKKAELWVNILPKQYCPNQLIVPIWLPAEPTDGVVAKGRYEWKVSYVVNKGDEYTNKKWEERAVHKVAVILEKDLPLPKQKLVIAKDTQNERLQLKQGEPFVLENSGLWAGCFPPPGGDATNGKFEVEFSGLMVVAFWAKGSSNFHFVKGDLPEPYGSFEVKEQ